MHKKMNVFNATELYILKTVNFYVGEEYYREDLGGQVIITFVREVNKLK